MTKRQIIAASAVNLVFLAASAVAPGHAQDLEPQPIKAGEIIVAVDGVAIAPWVFGSMCLDGGAQCRKTLVNQETGEVAIMRGELAGAFARTGNGEEVKRNNTRTTQAQNSAS